MTTELTNRNDSILSILLKFSPILVLAGLIIFEYDPLVAAPAATVYAAIIAVITEKFSFDKILNSAVDNVKELQLVFFILMVAYAMAEVFMASGVGASIINLALDFGITASSVAVIGFLVTAVLSIATGTSWGTFAACAPIFLWLNYIVGGNIALTAGAIAGGACFGDNIGLISDTTIVSSGIQKVEVMHRIRHQGVWSILCLILASIAFYVVASSMGLSSEVASGADAISEIPGEVWVSLEEERASAVALLQQVEGGVPTYMIIPLILVIGAAVMGLQTLICLAIGIASAAILGSAAGTIGGLGDVIGLIEEGFADAGSWVIVMMMWVGAFSGIMSKMGAFSGVSTLVLRMVNSVRGLMFSNAILSLLGNMALSDEMAQIVTVGPIQKELVDNHVEGSEEDKYKLRLRNATFSDALGVFGSQLIPWHVYIAYYVGICSAVFPLYDFAAMDIIKFNFMAMIAVGSILLLTFTGWDRFIPLFGLPTEPDVTLKKTTPDSDVTIES